METATKASDQFISDFLMVAENDYSTYQYARKMVAKKGVLGASEKIQEDFENWISQLATDEEERGNEVGSLLLRQLLIGWGADAFLQIALRFQEDN